MDLWYEQLNKVKLYLQKQDPILERLFHTVDNNGFKLYNEIKKPFPALIGVIIGQKINYNTARSLRKKLYEQFGIDFTPLTLKNKDISFLGNNIVTIINGVIDYITSNNIDINNEIGIKMLINVKGIGPWTINATLVTSLLSCDIYPQGDKFLEKRIRRLYGELDKASINNIIMKWSPYRSLVTWYLWRFF